MTTRAKRDIAFALGAPAGAYSIVYLLSQISIDGPSPPTDGWRECLFVACFSIFVAAFFFRWVLPKEPRPAKEKKKSQSLCSVCGYNLTGNTSGICPECGTAIAVSRRAEDVASNISRND